METEVKAQGSEVLPNVKFKKSLWFFQYVVVPLYMYFYLEKAITGIRYDFKSIVNNDIYYAVYYFNWTSIDMYISIVIDFAFGYILYILVIRKWMAIKSISAPAYYSLRKARLYVLFGIDLALLSIIILSYIMAVFIELILFSA